MAEEKILVVTYDGKRDERIEDFVSRLRPNKETIYVHARDFPLTPPQGTTEILVNCNITRYSNTDLSPYEGIPVSRLIGSRFGDTIGSKSESSLDDCCD